VDDDEAFRQGVASVLVREGGSAVQARNGKEALEYLQDATPPDLILLDMMMPVMDGWQFLKRRHWLPPLSAIPVLIMTGLGAASWDWAYSLGACGLVRKPVESEQLVQTIRHCLRKQTSHQDPATATAT
jgi:CheY-like chemotaxis protein